MADENKDNICQQSKVLDMFLMVGSKTCKLKEKIG